MGRLSNRLFYSVVACLLVALLFFVAASSEFNRQIEVEKRSLSDAMNVLAADLSGIMNSYIFYGYGVRAYIHENPDYEFEDMTNLIANLVMKDDKLLRNFSLLEDTTIVFSYPLEANKAALGKDLSKIEGQKDTVLKVKETGNTFITGPVNLVQGGQGVIIRMAVNLKDGSTQHYWGQVSSVLSYDELGKRIKIDEYFKNNNVRIYEKNVADKSIHSLWSNSEEVFTKPVKKVVSFDQSEWIIEAEPKGGWKGLSFLFFTIIFLGVFSSAAAGFGVYLSVEKRETLAQKIEEKTAELEKSYDELKEAQNQLIESEKFASLGVLVAGVAHEINTPLGISISTSSYMENINDEGRYKLSQGTMTKNDLKTYMDGMEESLRILNTNLFRTADLVGSFKQIAVDQNYEIRTDFYLAEYLNSILLSLGYEFKNSGIKVSVDCEKKLRLHSLPGAFTQVFTNLLMNAKIHGFPEEKAGNVHIFMRIERSSLLIDFKDDGIGIPKENLKKIFDPFFTTNRERGGSGLGLNVVYNIIVGKFKGTIRCESSPGEGTEFKINIPVEWEDGKWKTKE